MTTRMPLHEQRGPRIHHHGTSRRNTLAVDALAVALSMVLLRAGLSLFRTSYLAAIPSGRLPADAAGAIYDTLVRFIIGSLAAVLVLFLAIAAIAAEGALRVVAKGAQISPSSHTFNKRGFGLIPDQTTEAPYREIGRGLLCYR